MNCNVGGIDRAARTVIGVALLVVWGVVPLSALWSTVVLVVGAILLITALARTCPLNALFGINTCGHTEQP
ncbi:MAG TPA: DUF2892 domain-containing protein [Gammaproteobacteria bacterium]|nr:DUF2892 domain-containing protein [Gammaproteobacteria bacterium]